MGAKLVNITPITMVYEICEETWDEDEDEDGDGDGDEDGDEDDDDDEMMMR
jgi:hypothetical protein